MRTRRTKEQIRKDIYNKDVDAYNFYVVNLDTMKAETGFEFKEDAVDVLNDYDDKKKYKVVSKRALKSLGIENPNESFKYETGGNVKPFEYKEKKSTIMINGTKADVKKMYLDYKNNFLSVRKFAEHYNISETQANSIINQGRKYLKEDGYYADGGEFMTDPTFGNFQNNIYADGGGVGKVEHFPLDKEKLNEDAKWYADRIKSGKQTTTIKDIEQRIESDKKDLLLLEIGRIKPSKIIGTGYKGNTKKLANTYLLEQIYRQTKTLELLQDNYANGGGVTNNYVPRKNLNTITIKKGNQKLTYKISDVLNGAYKLESGAKLEDIAFYVPKRSIVKVQLKTGSDFKPANGYWIKDGAKPIHVTKFDDGGNLDGVNPYQNINSIRERYELLNDMYSNEESSVDYTDILKVGDVVYGDDIQGYARIYKEVNDPEKGDYFIFQDRFNDKFAFYIIQSIRGLRSKELFLQNVGISEKDFLYSPEVININQNLNFAKGRVRLYEKNPNNASNYHGINYDDYISALSKIKPLEENLRLMLKEERHKFYEGGVMSRLLTRKKDQPKVETTDEDIDLNEDSRIRVRPSSFVRKDKEGDWMMKKNSSKEARSYAGGGKIRYEDYDDEIDMWDKLSISQRKNLLDSQEDLEQYGNHSEIAEDDWDELDDYVTDVLENNFKNKMYAGGGKLTFSEKAKAIAKNFEGKRVEPKYQKEYGKVYDKKEAKEVGNKIAGSQKASYDAKLEKGSEVKKKAGNPKMKATLDLAKKIRKDGEKWTDAVKRASQQLK